MVYLRLLCTQEFLTETQNDVEEVHKTHQEETFQPKKGIPIRPRAPKRRKSVCTDMEKQFLQSKIELNNIKI